MKNIKSEIILLILIVVLVVIIGMNCKQKDGFTNDNFFKDTEIIKVSKSLQKEIDTTNNITEAIKTYKDNSENLKYYKKNNNGTYDEVENKDNNNKVLELNPKIDIDGILKYNNRIRSELNTINFDKQYNNLVKEAVEQHKENLTNEHNRLTSEFDSLKNTNSKNNGPTKCLTINNNNLEFHICNLLDNQRWVQINDDDTNFYKNPFTSKTLNLEKQKDLNLEKHEIELEQACFKNDGTKQNDAKLCNEDKLNYYLADNKTDYKNKYNENLQNTVFEITENNVDNLPRKFVYFTNKN